MWAMLLILIGALAVIAWAHDPKIDEAHRKFYGKYY